jgi:hypothetical protein
MPRAALVLPLLCLGACSASSPPAPITSFSTRCADPRPQVCTMEYDPVCGQLADGAREDYASPCNACAHDAVHAYQAGSCAGGAD